MVARRRVASARSFMMAVDGWEMTGLQEGEGGEGGEEEGQVSHHPLEMSMTLYYGTATQEPSDEMRGEVPTIVLRGDLLDGDSPSGVIYSTGVNGSDDPQS
jgi:hypothetical protein